MRETKEPRKIFWFLTIAQLQLSICETENGRRRSCFEVLGEKMAIMFWHDECKFFGGGLI